MISPRNIGDLLDSLGVKADLDDEDMVPSAVVLLKTVSMDSGVAVTIASSEGMSWLDQLGLIEAARLIVTSGGYERTEGDDG